MKKIAIVGFGFMGRMHYGCWKKLRGAKVVALCDSNLAQLEKASGGNIALVRDGDIITIDIPSRSISVRLSDEELAARRREEEARGRKAFTPPFRQRAVSKSLKAYAAMVSSADKGAIRIIED